MMARRHVLMKLNMELAVTTQCWERGQLGLQILFGRHARSAESISLALNVVAKKPIGM